jgi:oxygen-independent coproporphyrinogen-3 oxidase
LRTTPERAEIPDHLIARYDVPSPRYTSYPTVPAWTREFGPADHEAALRAASDLIEEPLSVYVHLPFCKSLCAYCGCNVVIPKGDEDIDAYVDLVLRELDMVRHHLGARQRVSQLHWGGGTPTLLPPHLRERLWRALVQSFSVADDAEIAIEADPRVTTLADLHHLRALGFNRISFGVQDLDPAVQEKIGRHQTVVQTRAALDGARAAGFAGVNVDLIYGLPGQTNDSVARTIDLVSELGPDRVALYSFAWVPEARPNQRRLPLAEIPGGRPKLELFLLARARLAAAGYRAIGMDHFARRDDELARALEGGHLHRNFQGYAVKAAPDVVALGASAISDLAGAFAQNLRSLPQYRAAIEAGRLPTARGHWLDADDRRRRAIIMAIMCGGAIDLGTSNGDFSVELEELAAFANDGLVELDGPRVHVTALGSLFVRNVAAVFDAHLRSARQGGALMPLSRSV